MSLPPFVIPGRHFSRSLAELRNELIFQFQGNGPLPLERIFDFIQLTTSNASLQRKLVRRGSFEKAASGSWANRGRIINELMHDIGQQLDKLRLYVPRDVEFETVESGDALTLDLGSSRILVIFFEPPAPGVGQRFVIKSLRIEPTKWRYFGVNDDDPTQDIEIVVDLKVEPQQFRRPRSDFRGFEQSNVLLKARPKPLFSNRNCTCCNAFEAAKPPPAPGPRVVTLHAKLIAEPTHDLDDQIRAMNDVFTAAEIRVELASVENLVGNEDAEEFLDLNVGECRRGNVTDEQEELFREVRDNVGAGEVCFYWIRTSIPDLAGCAAHPEGLPSFIVTEAASPWTLAHELGHVLGLIHVGDQDNLMSTPTALITNPPPDLTADQVVIMRSSDWAPLEEQPLVAAK